MKELPILFKGEMIRAIFDGRKWQTRRVMRPQPRVYGSGAYVWEMEGRKRRIPNGPRSVTGGSVEFINEAISKYSPYGRPGDHLYAKETWAAIWPDVDPVPLEECRIEYRADTADPYPGGWPEEEARGNDEAPKWRSSLFVPKWAARLWLLNKRVRVERVQEISIEDAIAEGVEDCEGAWDWLPKDKPDGLGLGPKKFVTAFSHLWDSINAKPRPIYRTIDGRKTITHYESFPWQEGTYTAEYRGLAHHVYGNPFVWVVDFEKVER